MSANRRNPTLASWKRLERLKRDEESELRHFHFLYARRPQDRQALLAYIAKRNHHEHRCCD